MYREKLDLKTALEWESEGKITIIDRSKTKTGSGILNQSWKDNFQALQTKATHISPELLLNYFSARYVIEIPEKDPSSEGKFSWTYVYAIENKNLVLRIKNDTEYVYVMVNPGYPDLVKIGVTTQDVLSRAKGINTAGTVFEWVPKFALPVLPKTAFKIEQQVHQFFSTVRVSSDRGGEREFFKLDPLTAFDKIREVGALFSVGSPVYY